MASDLEDLIVLRKQYPEIITMCKAVDVETDTELEMLMGDKIKGSEKKARKCKKTTEHRIVQYLR